MLKNLQLVTPSCGKLFVTLNSYTGSEIVPHYPELLKPTPTVPNSVLRKTKYRGGERSEHTDYLVFVKKLICDETRGRVESKDIRS